MNLKKQRILVVVAHPDDDLLGCGATLIKAISNKSLVKILFLGEGVSSRFGIGNEFSKKSIDAKYKRNKECTNSLKILGIKNFIFENRLCTRFDELPLLNIVKSIEREIVIFKPTVIFTHNPHEVNIDHTITYKAVEVATRPTKKTSIKSIYSFEIICSGNWSFNKKFVPTSYVDISKEFTKKLKAWQCYQNESKPFPFPRSNEGLTTLAKYRGMQSFLKYSEAFKLEREII